MEIDVVGLATIAASSGAGWYAGHYFERKKALKFFAQAQKYFLLRNIESTNGIAKAAVALLQKYKPGVNSSNDLTDELLQSCREQGLYIQRMTPEKAKQHGVDLNA